MNILKFLQEIANDKDNIVVYGKDTIFESSYPKFVFDVVSIKNEYLDIKSLENFDFVKFLKIKNQITSNFIVVKPSDILNIEIVDSKMIVKYNYEKQVKKAII